MFQARGLRLRLTKGDYGVPLPIHLVPACEDCGTALCQTDVLRLTIERANTPLVVKNTTWGDVQGTGGYYILALTKEEADALDLGIYTWRVCLLRDGKVRHTFVTQTLEVVL